MRNRGSHWEYLDMSIRIIIHHSRMIKYEHSDAGLSYTNVKIKKLRTF